VVEEAGRMSNSPHRNSIWQMTQKDTDIYWFIASFVMGYNAHKWSKEQGDDGQCHWQWVFTVKQKGLYLRLQRFGVKINNHFYL
jgi:hypothetical protein